MGFIYEIYVNLIAKQRVRLYTNLLANCAQGDNYTGFMRGELTMLALKGLFDLEELKGWETSFCV